MARKSKSDRINEILRANPMLKREDPRISELIDAEALLRKAQRAARTADITTESRNGVKRHPALIAVDHAEKAVRRLRNELQIDRIGVKRSEQAGTKAARSPSADQVLETFLPGIGESLRLVPGEAAFLAAHGIDEGEIPEEHRELFRTELAKHADLVPGIRERLKTYGKW